MLVLQEAVELPISLDDMVYNAPEAKTIELSVNLVVGLIPLHTMKIWGQIGGENVIVLIDSGATHNFISVELVQKLELPLPETGNYGLLMGIELSAEGMGVCRGASLSLPMIEVVDDFLSIDIGSSNVILGI